MTPGVIFKKRKLATENKKEKNTKTANTQVSQSVRVQVSSLNSVNHTLVIDNEKTFILTDLTHNVFFKTCEVDGTTHDALIMNTFTQTFSFTSEFLKNPQ